MPALKPTLFSARVVWLGHVKDSEENLTSQKRESMDLTFAGLAEEFHAGLTRLSCSRVKAQYPKGTPIKNARQLSVVSREELDAIAETMGIAELDPSLIGASMMIEGVPDFSHVPPSSRLISQNGTGLVVDMENRPCHLPAPFIDEKHPGVGRGFKAAAHGRRGVTAYVEREGTIALGDELRLHIPDQPVWEGLASQ